MTQEVLVNVETFETRVAVLEGGQLQELHLARANAASVTGNIYSGRVVRVLPGMQAAFVDVGLERPGFLHAKDIRGSHWPAVEAARVAGEDAPLIERLLGEGDRVLVQVAKDPISSKGARLTTHLALPSRYLVLMPFSAHIGVSQRIEDETERERLRAEVEAARASAEVPEGFGFIVRTVADGAQAAEIAADMAFLVRSWERIDGCRHDLVGSSLVYEELPVQVRVLRDLVDRSVDAIRIDCPDTHAAMRRYAERFLPELNACLHHHQAPTPLFEGSGVEAEISRALSRRVPLKCGGHLVIEQTEAMTTIDVNTGGYVGARNLEDTVFKANLEAAAAIPQQLRLRNLGGIVVIDFIDMEDPEHQRSVVRALEKAAEGDPARIRVFGISELGLVELSRKRTRESLRQQLCAPCETCDGRGYLRRAESVCFEIFRTVQRDARRREDVSESAYLVRAGQSVLDRLLDEDADALAALADHVGRPIRLQLEPSYGVEDFDVVGLQDLS